MTKHLVCEASYRLELVKNKVDNKVDFLLKRRTNYAAVLLSTSYFLQSVSKSLSTRVHSGSVVFSHDIHLCITSKLPGSFKTCVQAFSTTQNFSRVETHFRSLLVVNSMKLSIKNRHR